MSATIEICRTRIDPMWDEFLASTPGNHHAQTSRWGQLKTSGRGDVVRLLARQGGEIVAGVQVLLLHLPLIGAVGYAPRGPVVADSDPAIIEQLLNALRKEAAQLGLCYLLMQPPEGEETLEEEFRFYGFSPSRFAPEPTATVKIDLQRESDALLARMKKNTRRLIRHGLSIGLTGREAGEADLPIVHTLLAATAERQGFTAVSLEHLESMWQLLAPPGWLKLFLVERGGEAISAALIIAFGDTVVAKSIGWTGHDSSLGANQLLEWNVITWAKERGYRYYDLEGIDSKLAVKACNGECPLTPQEHGRTYFKLSYGGDIVFLPGGYEHLQPGLLNWIYEHGVRRFVSPQVLDRMATRLRAQ